MSQTVSTVAALLIGLCVGFFIGQNTYCVKMPWSTSQSCVFNNPVK